MSGTQSRWIWGAVTVGVMAVGIMTGYGETPVQESQAKEDEAEGQDVAERVAPEELLSQDTVVFFQVHGSAGSEQQWQETAAYEAIQNSGLDKVFDKIMAFVENQVGFASDEAFEALGTHIAQHGLSVSVSIPSAGALPIPQATVVLHDAAEHAPTIEYLVEKGFGEVLPMTVETMNGRAVNRGVVRELPVVEASWWVEGNHIIVTAGMVATMQAMSVVNGQTPNLSGHRLLEETSGGGELTPTARLWFDMARIRKTYGNYPVPLPDGRLLVVNQLLDLAGLNSLDAVTHVSGYDGRAMATETQMIFDGEPSGLISLAAQRNITWADLPPLPPDPMTVAAGTIDLSRVYDTVLDTAFKVSAFGPPDARASIERVLGQVEDELGLNLRRELLGTMGDIVCVYGDPRQGFFGTGGAVVLQVKDEQGFQRAVDQLLKRAQQEARQDFRVHRIEKQGRQMLTFEFGQVAQAGALVVSDGWCVISLMPQAAEAFLLRIDGKLPRWDPKSDSRLDADAQLPAEFSSFTFVDPEPAYHALAKIAPFAVSFAIGALKEERLVPRDLELPISPADMPVPELVVGSLFPNVSSSRTQEDRVVWSSRSSLPGIPLLSGVGGGGSIGTAAVLTGLLLPAVQQARTAARRTHSVNNLKQLGLAMHNYYDVHKQFPTGTVPNEKLEPEQRLSWMVSILPYVEQSALHRRIDVESGWNDEKNRNFTRSTIRMFMNPGYAGPTASGTTQYVGIAGLGEGAERLPVTDPKAGVFGIDRATRFNHILDGSSNTVMISEASGQMGPWAAGGSSTIRALIQKPYINGPDGIGGPFPGGCNMGLCDGAVRFISEKIDPKVMEALVTIRGGEVIGGF